MHSKRGFKKYGAWNGPCREVETLRGLVGSVCLEPFNLALRFRDQEMNVEVARAEVGKVSGGITNEEILTAKQKLVLFLQAAAVNKESSTDLQTHVQSWPEKIIPFAGTSPALFVDPKSIILKT